MANLMGYLDTLDKKLHEKNQITDYLEKAEKATGVRRLYIALGLGVFWALYMVVGHGAELICNTIGFAYPAYQSMHALESETKVDDTKWLTYWVAFATFSLLEFFSEVILDFIPLYWLLKCLFLIWCFVPIDNNGSVILYERFIRPVFTRRHHKIDEALGKGTGVIKDLIADGASRMSSSKSE